MAESAPHHAATRRFRPRFSLLTAFLLTAIVSLSITVALFYSELRSLRKETQWYRDEYGILTITDRSKIHAIQLRTNKNLTWKWRVWIPEGQPVDLARIFGKVPRSGFPHPDSAARFIDLRPGEHTLNVSIHKNEVTGSWEAVTDFQGVSSRMKISADQQWFAHQGNFATSKGGVERTTQVVDFADEGKFLLYRLRAVPGANSSVSLDSDEPLPGLMIWLEQR